MGTLTMTRFHKQTYDLNISLLHLGLFDYSEYEIDPDYLLCDSSKISTIRMTKLHCWGVTQKIWMIPLTRERGFLARSSTELELGETVIASADCTSSQKSESVYTCPRAPFYREMKGLLHTKNALRLREYSQCERIQECLFRLTYLQICL
jgi:hypothetical protein